MRRAVRHGAAARAGHAGTRWRSGIQQALGGVGGRRLRLFQQAHRQRLRLRRAVRHAHLLPHRLGPLEDRRLHRAHQHRASTTASARSSCMAHTNAIFSPPGVGRHPARGAPRADFRIDHDQKFNATTNLQYVFNTATGAWAALSWRYDSGLVAGAVGSIDDALALTADSAGGDRASSAAVSWRIARQRRSTSCDCRRRRDAAPHPRRGHRGRREQSAAHRAASPVRSRASASTTCSATDRAKVRVRFSVMNLTNKEALYNFLSTFSGTHFVTPRAYQFQVGVGF